MIVQMLMVVGLILSLAGCATFGNTKSSTKEIETQISELEEKLQERDNTIRDLETQLEKSRKSKLGITVTKSDVSSITKKQIQAALKNAGYYNGSIDGKVGQLTTTAIKQFQKDNGLKEDGVVGQQTWSKLSQHLE